MKLLLIWNRCSPFLDCDKYDHMNKWVIRVAYVERARQIIWLYSSHRSKIHILRSWEVSGRNWNE